MEKVESKSNNSFVNLNINPCKMCMPMGAVLAFKGIAGSMMILHGSQGCSTYIRRHMAGHYNEPVDIASSSLSEEGTVYGGEKNLKQGLRNMIHLYNPQVIGVATTCLAETIGEDIRRITAEFTREEGLEPGRIIPVQTPGYGGTQFEGYFAALLSMVKSTVRPSAPHGGINIITSPLNPGEVRNLKEILDAFGMKYTLLPDVSETLDAPYGSHYRKIPEGGTTLEEIRSMAGAAVTIELGLTVPLELSPGYYLDMEFDVPLYRCPLPIGLRNTDRLVRLLSEITDRSVPQKLQRQRGRLLDGMIDSHKHSAEGRAVIFGDPELVYAVSSLCAENGIRPALLATGSCSRSLKSMTDAAECPEKPVILDDTDFHAILEYVKQTDVNLLIGNSDGKVITEREGIPLVRLGFPIHDRVGGQRLSYTGYEGSLRLLDDLVNTLLEEKYSRYRSAMFARYHEQAADGADAGWERLPPDETQASAPEKVLEHPCFSGKACSAVRMHLPVAPACNISCKYCSRKYDCANESRPGVTSRVLTPGEAAAKFLEAREKLGNLTVVGIAGPGDALANFENTRKTLELIREQDARVLFCLSTNGLLLPRYAEELVRLGVTHVTVTINAVDPAIGEKIYREVVLDGERLTGRRAAEVLLANQLEGLQRLSAAGVVCKVNIVAIQGVNVEHVEEVVKTVREYGAYITNIMPLIPAPGSAFEHMPLISALELSAIRKVCGSHLRQMHHCRQCRADAVGTLDNDRSAEFYASKEKEEAEELAETSSKVLTLAVATRFGKAVDLHFGHATGFHIYRVQAGIPELLEVRNVDQYCAGEDSCGDTEDRMERITGALADCDAVLALRIGYSPMKKLEARSVRVIQTCGGISEAIDTAVRQLEAV